MLEQECGRESNAAPAPLVLVLDIGAWVGAQVGVEIAYSRWRGDRLHT